MSINYKGGYKYQITESYAMELPVGLKSFLCGNAYVQIASPGLTIMKGYAWDGPSGPTIDTLNFMRGSLVHDALYQLMREGKLPPTCRKFADRLLKQMCRNDGMSWIRAEWVYLGVRIWGKKAASTSQRKEVEVAP